MSPWAARRKFFILLIVGSVIAAFLVTILIAAFTKVPSCTDNTQNQGEAGVDCGGPCAFLCLSEVQPPTVLFTKAVNNGAGRIDIVAAVENKNANAGVKNVPYRVQLYSANRTLIREIVGMLDLPPSASVPVFLPGVSSAEGSSKPLVTSAFLSVNSSELKWFAFSPESRIVPTISNTKQSGTIDAPRIEAILANPHALVFTNVYTIVLVRDAQGSIIAASQTVVPSIPAQGTATATFTWSGAFPSIPASIEVVPIIPLPNR